MGVCNIEVDFKEGVDGPYPDATPFNTQCVLPKQTLCTIHGIQS
jgi:hypothetical protein